MEQTKQTTEQYRNKKRRFWHGLLAFLKVIYPYIVLCAVYGILMLVFGPKDKGSEHLSVDVPNITLPVVGTVSFSIFCSALITLCCILFLLYLNLFYFKRLTEYPKKLQNYLQLFVTKLDDFSIGRVGDVIGKEISPYLFALATYILLGSGLELFGLTAVTADINTTAGLGLCTFLVINYVTIRHKGLKFRAQSYLRPAPFIAPMKLLSDLTVPISLACRLYGNVLAGMIVMELIYSITAFLIPPIMSIYFNLFHMALQSYIFVFLSLSYVGEALD